MSKKPTMPADRLEAYDKLIASLPDIDRKGATMPYTSLNGHMFSFLDKEGKMSIRLPAEALEVFLKEYKTEHSVQHGRIMKEYALVPDDLLDDTEKMRKIVIQSRDYIATLKPKPSKKKK